LCQFVRSISTKKAKNTISLTTIMSVDSYHHVRHEVIFQVVASDRHPARPIGWRRRILYYDTDDVDVVGLGIVSFRSRWSAMGIAKSWS